MGQIGTDPAPTLDLSERDIFSAFNTLDACIRLLDHLGLGTAASHVTLARDRLYEQINGPAQIDEILETQPLPPAAE